MLAAKRRKYSTAAEKAEAKRRHNYDSRQRKKSRKDLREPEEKPFISFLVYVPPYIPLESQASEDCLKTAEAVQQLSTRYDHLAKGPTMATGRPLKYNSRKAALKAKKENDHQRYLRRREQRQREKQALSESVQVVPECRRQQTTTRKARKCSQQHLRSRRFH